MHEISTRRRKRLLRRPAASESAANGGAVDCVFFAPIGKYLRAAADCNAPVRAHVSVLLATCGPTAIIPGITFFVVSAIKSFSDWLQSHFFQEGAEVGPFGDVTNPAPAVVFVRRILLAVATMAHRAPDRLGSPLLLQPVVFGDSCFTKYLLDRFSTTKSSVRSARIDALCRAQVVEDVALSIQNDIPVVSPVSALDGHRSPNAVRLVVRAVDHLALKRVARCGRVAHVAEEGGEVVPSFVEGNPSATVIRETAVLRIDASAFGVAPCEVGLGVIAGTEEQIRPPRSLFGRDGLDRLPTPADAFPHTGLLKPVFAAPRAHVLRDASDGDSDIALADDAARLLVERSADRLLECVATLDAHVDAQIGQIEFSAPLAKRLGFSTSFVKARAHSNHFHNI